ncbi:uncharacterized protein C8R40DRAFT_1155636 [Lentinula edodes]|uniref:uncharacterized protein n=1 Tax=Lentinula edodes TaxID=5353 RepID=UPI001E8E9275|nr:uncharacterized protein C8R40DRAFT_1155636 [Lentinula edodes]KAH7869188.1 hypothetical protein C8R40DRAFT_1155636 [Lentinula edodes]
MALFLIVLINIFLLGFHGFSSWNYFLTNEEPKYTFSGSSVPLLHPMINDLPVVLLTLQETDHLQWNAMDNVSRDEYYTLLDYPAISILSSNHHMFILSWFHNLHCIAQFRAALNNHTDWVATQEHFHHCLHYLRQILLCNAGDMLEPGDFMTRNFTTERIGGELMCYDFEKAQSILQAERDDFNTWYNNQED